MTNAEIDRMTAERVMGWAVHFRNTAHYVDPNAKDYVVKAWVSEFHPSTNWSHTGMVVERMRELGWHLGSREIPSQWTHFSRWDDTRIGSIQEKLSPYAVTIAALRAVTGERIV